MRTKPPAHVAKAMAISDAVTRRSRTEIVVQSSQGHGQKPGITLFSKFILYEEKQFTYIKLCKLSLVDPNYNVKHPSLPSTEQPNPIFLYHPERSLPIFLKCMNFQPCNFQAPTYLIITQ